MEILKKNPKEMLHIKNTEIGVKKASDELICRLYTAEERISDPTDISIDSSKTESKEKTEGKKKKHQNKMPKDWGEKN